MVNSVYGILSYPRNQAQEEGHGFPGAAWSEQITLLPFDLPSPGRYFFFLDPLSWSLVMGLGDKGDT